VHVCTHMGVCVEGGYACVCCVPSLLDRLIGSISGEFNLFRFWLQVNLLINREMRRLHSGQAGTISVSCLG